MKERCYNQERNYTKEDSSIGKVFGGIYSNVQTLE
jgi:hypothetical protein